MEPDARSRLAVPRARVPAHAVALRVGGDPLHGPPRATFERGVAALSGPRRVMAASGSVPTAVVLAGVSLYGWLQARGGHALAEAGPQASGKSMRSSVASSGLARR